MRKRNREEKRRKSERIRQLSEKCTSCTVVTDLKYAKQLEGCIGCPVRKELDQILGPAEFSRYEYTYQDVVEAFESSSTQKEAMFKLSDWSSSLEKTILKDITGWCSEWKLTKKWIA